MERLAADRRGRRDVDDRPSAAPPHQGDGGVADVENALDVDGQGFLENPLVQVPHVERRPDPGVVDDDVESPPAAADRRGHRVHGFLVRKLGVEDQTFPAQAFHFLLNVAGR